MFLKALLLTLCFVSVAAFAHRASAQDYEAYYMMHSNYPVAETQWSDDAQGVAHDDSNWFITNTHFIRKIPVQHDLRTVNLLSPGVIYKTIGEYPALVGYNHFGDPDVFRIGGTDYLVVPIEDGEATCTTGLRGGIAIFHCTDLSYIAHATFPDQCNDAGWVAIDEQGTLVSSRQHVGELGTSPPCTSPGLRFYTFNWTLFHATGHASMTFSHEVHPMDEQGRCLEMVTMQGGEFAPGGHLLYLVSGFYDDSHPLRNREGIHVLETVGYQRIQHSVQGLGHFVYSYDAGPPAYEEPEGLTIWDLDDERAPGIRGQLHVFISDNDFDIGDSGDIKFCHFTQVIRVNPSSGAGCEFGSPSCPFRSLAPALSGAWDGADVRLHGGVYADRPRISTRIRLSAENGVVRIGG